MRFDAGTLEGFRGAAKLRSSDTNTAKIFGSPIVRGLLEVSSVVTVESTKPPVNSPLLETFAKLNSSTLPVTEKIKLSGTFDNASTWERIAESLRPLHGGLRPIEANLWPLETPVQQAGCLQSAYDPVPGGVAIKHAIEAQHTTLQTTWGNVVQGFQPPVSQVYLGTSSSPMFTQLAEIVKAYMGFSERVGEVIASLSRPLAGASEWLRELMEQGPLDPYGEPVPAWNVRLYELAEAAYYVNDYVAQAMFLNEIDADESADNVLFIQDLLRPTFDPDRLDRRHAWEQREPSDARRWLRKRLSEHRNGGKDKHELPYEENPNEENPGVALVTPSMSVELMNPDGAWDREPTYLNGATPSAMAEFMKQERERSLPRQLQAMLPERQYQVLLCLVEGMIYEEIAYRLGIGVSTVKTHVGYLRQKHDLKALLSS